MELAVRDLFERQHGVATTQQVLDLGESYETIARRVHNNDWVRPMPRVVAPVGAALTFEGRLMAAKLSIGGELAFGGLTALALWQLPDAAPPHRLHVVVADNRDAHSTDDIYVQRRSALLAHTFVRAGWPIVSVEAALLATAACADFAETVNQLQDAFRLRRTKPARLGAVCGRGVKGSSALQAALKVAGDGMGSLWERRLARQLKRPDRPRPVAQHRVVSAAGLVAYLDLAFPDVLLAIEIDGYVAHTRPTAFRHDRARQNTLVTELEWTILRYTPFEIASAPDRLVAQIWRCYDRLRATGS